MAYTIVTGGSGFIGQHLVQQLRERGDTVGVIDLQLPRKKIPEVEYHQVSILDKAQLRYLLPGVEHLYHLAANSQLWGASEQDFTVPNVEGTRCVMEVALEARVQRIVYTSTESILGAGQQAEDPLIDESTPLPDLKDMPGAYTRSKWKAEQLVRQLIQEDQPISIVYPTTPVGPGDFNMTAPTRMIHDFLHGKMPAYYETTLNWIDVRDVARGHILAMHKGQIGERYILGHRNIPLGEFLQLLESLIQHKMSRRPIPYPVAWMAAVISTFVADHFTKRPPRAVLEGVRLSRNGLRFDTQKARASLGLSCRPLEDSLQDALHWFAQYKDSAFKPRS